MLLHRIDPDRDERRFYFITVQPWLLGNAAVVRVWGRIGGWQRVLVTPCATVDEAAKKKNALVRQKIKRGYRQVAIPERRKKP